MTRNNEPDRGAGQPAPLDYQRPSAAHPLSIPKVLAGVAGSAVAIALAVPMAVMYLGTSGFLIVAGVIVGLVVLALSMRRDPGRRSYAIGLWIGLGLTLLIEGVCWFSLNRALSHH